MANTFDAAEDFLRTADMPCGIPSDNCWDAEIAKGGPSLPGASLRSSGEPENECTSFHWPGNTALGTALHQPGSPGVDDFRGLHSPQDFAELTKNPGVLKEEAWPMKAEISTPLSPITPPQIANPCNIFSVDASRVIPQPARLPTAPCPFPLEQMSANAEAVLSSILSPVEGGTVEATLDDIDLSDINLNNGASGVCLIDSTPATEQKRQEPVYDDSHDITFEMALNASNGALLLDPTAADFEISGVHSGAPSYTDSMDVDVNAFGSTISLGKDVMARAVIAAASAEAAGSSEDRARPWACELCPSRFSIKGHLSQHNRYVHEKYRPHCCPRIGCSASFGTRFARSQHVWTVHERKKPFVCEEPGCKASFGQRSHLNRHRKRHRNTTTDDPELPVPTPQGDPQAPQSLKFSAAKPISKSKKKRAQSRPLVGGVANHVANHIFGHLPSSLGAGSSGSRV